MFGAKDIPVVFIAAPTSYYRVGVADDLLEESFAPNKGSAVTMHRKYNQIGRNIAEETGSFLLDLEFDFNSLDNCEEMFQRDGIHFPELGLDLVAERIAEFVEATVLSSERAITTGR